MADEAQGRTYEQAVERLEQIIQRLDSGEAELRETLALCTEAKELIVFCKGELEAVSGRAQGAEARRVGCKPRADLIGCHRCGGGFCS